MSTRRQLNRVVGELRRGRAVQTHHVRFDEPSATARLRKAACGALIQSHEQATSDTAVTCADCRRWLADYDTLAIA
jgi:hypothetical protein